MSRKIFWSIWAVALAVMVLCLSVAMFALYGHFTDEHLKQLWNETRLAQQGVSQSGLSYFENLQPDDFRITWITEDGRILYDTNAEYSAMENHLAREEVQNALKYGTGQSERYSATLSAQQLYTAVRMQDGTVLRLSITIASMRELFLSFLVPGFAVGLGAMLVALLIAAQLSARIVQPINTLDLDHPLEEPHAYPEIRPLLERLEAQHIQINKDKENLERISLMRQEFTANASHELKTPLHVLSGYAELIENGMVRPNDIPVFAGRIRSEAQRMTKLVEDIIDLSQLDGGSGDRTWEETDLYRIAVNTVESLQTAADETGVEITVTGVPARIYGLQDILHSIVYNLCDNAIKYSKPGGHVHVQVDDAPDKAILIVEDDGIGIPKADQERIFERFYRVDKSHSKEVGGTGLGLSIVKHAVLIHNAEIKVDSEPGKGSRFTITFPKTQPENR